MVRCFVLLIDLLSVFVHNLQICLNRSVLEK